MSRRAGSDELVFDGLSPGDPVTLRDGRGGLHHLPEGSARGFLPYRNPEDPPQKFLRALEVDTGKIAWEIQQVGTPESNYSGVLSTAGGVVF